MEEVFLYFNKIHLIIVGEILSSQLDEGHGSDEVSLGPDFEGGSLCLG
jgi:hypothetical protein